MTNNELLMAMSEMMDKKLKSTLRAELQPIKDDIKEMKGDIVEMKGDIAELKDRVTRVEGDIVEMKGDIAELKDRVTRVEGDIAGLKDKVTRIDLHLENVTDKNIQILAENYLPAAKKFEKVALQVQNVQEDVDVWKGVVAEHSQILNKIS